MLSLPGCALASAISSFTLFTGRAGVTTSTESAFTMREIGSKSFSVSNGRLR